MAADVAGAEGRVCAQRDRFGIEWRLALEDTLDDGRSVTADIELAVADADDPRATLQNDRGGGTTTSSRGSFHPRVGSAISDLSLSTCVDIRFLPDRCSSSSVEVPQLASGASPAQAARLEDLVFERSLDDFLAIRANEHRTGTDAAFDWTSDGCSAGRFAEILEDALEPACLRHDFAYRNYGQLFLDPRDSVRKRVDEQLAADAEASGQGDLSLALLHTLQRFGAPVFFGEELATVWDLPASLAVWLQPD